MHTHVTISLAISVLFRLHPHLLSLSTQIILKHIPESKSCHPCVHRNMFL